MNCPISPATWSAMMSGIVFLCQRLPAGAHRRVQYISSLTERQWHTLHPTRMYLLIQLMGCGRGIDRRLGLLGSWLRMGWRAARWIRTGTGHSKGARHTRLISTARCENLAPDTGFHRRLLKDPSLPASQGQPRGGAMHHSQNAISTFTFLKY